MEETREKKNYINKHRIRRIYCRHWSGESEAADEQVAGKGGFPAPVSLGGAAPLASRRQRNSGGCCRGSYSRRSCHPVSREGPCGRNHLELLLTIWGSCSEAEGDRCGDEAGADALARGGDGGVASTTLRT